MPCDPLITDPFEFPRRAINRPALPHIGHRIGRYEDFLEAMMRHIDAAGPLAAWTHREPDDPAIALLHAAAIVGDILSFYQEHYANEAYLRTAAWRESVAELVRLTGYRLAPGLGGRASFAFEVRGATPVTIGAGFAVKTELQDVPGTADFQTVADLVAWPQLGRFHLYRRRLPQPTIEAGTPTIELSAVEGATDADSLATVELKTGDRLMLVPGEDMFTRNGAAYSTQQAPQLVTILQVERRLGRVLITLDSGPAFDWAAPVRAFRIGRSFRHFGHNAPPQVLTPAVSSGTVTGTTSAATEFVRAMNWIDSTWGFGGAYTSLHRNEMPLDVEANELAPGRRLVIQGMVSLSGHTSEVPFTVVRVIAAGRSRTVQWGNLLGPSTVLTLANRLFPNTQLLGEAVDIRALRLHEVTSPRLSLRPLVGFAAGAFADGSEALYYWGSGAQAAPLAGRRLHLAHPDGRQVALVCTDEPAAFATDSPTPRMWPLSFDRAPTPFTKDDFDEAVPSVTVFGNLAEATQGKSERDAVLGSGDHGQAFQTFTLPKAPLTYLLDSAATPPQQPELEIWVGSRRWTPVDALFGCDAKDAVYIVREDAEGRSHVQFGDGVTGARLPTGVDNVIARYRRGSGARGPIKIGATPTAAQRPVGFDKVTLAGIVAGGADPEDLEKAREAAPGRVQSLGRLVSLRDHETETLALPGVVAARAAWDLHAGVPAVILRVLLAGGREAEFNAVRDAIAHAQRCRGPNRHPIVVEQALLRYVYLDLTYARDPSLDAATVDAALRAALGLAGDTANERSGLFGLHARGLGAREYASRIEGRVQQVPGVLWCKVMALGRFAGGVREPATLMLPTPPRRRRATLRCGPRELLQLDAHHLTLTEASEPSAGACA